MVKNKANETISGLTLLFEVHNKQSQKILPAGLGILASILEGAKYTFEKKKKYKYIYIFASLSAINIEIKLLISRLEIMLGLFSPK